MREVPIIEILWHGRGGQGAFTAARLLGAACSFADGRYALAFPSFGPERRGAPMRAFTKLDRKPVGDRSAVSQADIVIYLDNTLFGEGWEAELKEGGKVLVNTQETFDDPRVVSIDADGISAAILGRVIPNTVLRLRDAELRSLEDEIGWGEGEELSTADTCPVEDLKSIKGKRLVHDGLREPQILLLRPEVHLSAFLRAHLRYLPAQVARQVVVALGMVEDGI